MATARWRGVAQTLVIVLFPVCLWCRESALKQEPEIQRLTTQVRELEGQVAAMQLELTHQKDAAAQQLHERDNEFAEVRANLLKQLAAKDAKSRVLKARYDQLQGHVAQLQATLAVRQEQRPPAPTRRATVPGRTYPQATRDWWERY